MPEVCAVKGGFAYLQDFEIIFFFYLLKPSCNSNVVISGYQMLKMV